jgi:hypothetical protein
MVISPIITRRSVKEVGELLTCGERIEGRGGYFYRPTILTKVTPSMEVAQEEVIGSSGTVLPLGEPIRSSIVSQPCLITSILGIHYIDFPVNISV